jgi:hypothetical protein
VALAPAHLFQSGLIGKMGTNAQMLLQSQFGAVHMAANTAGNTSAAYLAANPAVRNVIIFYNLPCEVVIEVDRALDDGDSTAGRARGSVACTAGGSLARYFVPL